MSQIDLRIALWNSNGLLNHLNELELFINGNKIDILLVTETHGTDRTYVKIPGYRAIFANHPSNKAYGGSAIIIKNSLNYIEYPPETSDAIQTTKIELQFVNERVVIASVYCRPRFSLGEADFDSLLQPLGNKFIIGGDFNSKHTHWGSRLCNPKGRQLLKSVQKNNIKVHSGGSPTYWPSDPGKIPDLIDIFLSKGLPIQSFSVENSFELSSDHSPVILTCCNAVLARKKPQKIDYHKFRENLSNKINLRVSLKSSADIEAITEETTKLIKGEIENCTSEISSICSSHQYSAKIRNQIEEKRRIRALWQRTRDPRIKSKFNKLAKQLKEDLKLVRDLQYEDKIKNLTATQDTDYSLWKELSHINRPIQRKDPIRNTNGTWQRSDKEKASAFRDHLCTVFTPYSYNADVEDLNQMNYFVDCPMPMCFDLPPVTIREISFQIKRLNARKAPGSDGISARTIKNLPPQAIKLIMYIFNAILTLGHFPSLWKMARVVMVLKPGKNAHDVSSYRPISILSVFSKLIERIILHRMQEYMETVIPDHQFGFRSGHGTTEQCHRVVEYIKEAYEKKEYCSGVFIDVSQAFDKVWHVGLLYKIKCIFPRSLYVLLRNYISDRKFFVQVGTEHSELGSICSGVPQGSVVGPHLYVLFTHDLPQINEGFNGTFADDTVFLFSDLKPEFVSLRIQAHINLIENWCDRWNIKININKCQHVTFTLNKSDCPPVTYKGELIPRASHVRYLGLYLDRRLTFKDHIDKKRKELDIKRKKFYYILNRNSPLSLKNKLLIYKVMLKPIWTYCLPLWGLASSSNIEKIQRFQNITLRVCTGAPNFLSNEDLHKDLSLTTVQEEIHKVAERHRSKIENHRNALVDNLLSVTNTRLKKKLFCNL